MYGEFARRSTNVIQGSIKTLGADLTGGSPAPLVGKVNQVLTGFCGRMYRMKVCLVAEVKKTEPMLDIDYGRRILYVRLDSVESGDRNKVRV
jgi:hypothetical protein